MGGLSTLTNLDGNYELLLSSVTSGVQDFASHPLTNDMSLKWTVDLTPPLVTIEPLTTISTRPSLSGTVDDRNAVVKVTLNNKEYVAENFQGW